MCPFLPRRAEWPGRLGNADLGCGASCGQVSFSLCQFPESEIIHQSSGEICGEKPISRIPAQTIPHRLGPMPKRFPVRGDPSAPSSRLLCRLSPAQGRLCSLRVSQRAKELGSVLRGDQALSLVKERFEDKMRRAALALLSSPAGIRSLPSSAQSLAAQRLCPSPWGNHIRTGGPMTVHEGEEGSSFQVQVSQPLTPVSVPPCPSCHLPPP